MDEDAFFNNQIIIYMQNEFPFFIFFKVFFVYVTINNCL